VPSGPSDGMDDAASLASRFGYPLWMVERFCEFVPDVAEMLAELERPPRRYIRINSLRTSEEGLRSSLEAKGFDLAGTAVPGCLEIKKEPHSAGASSEYLRGLYYLQDIASQIPARVLAPKATDVVVDCCAAPGGKTTQLAALMGNAGLLVAMEADEQRIPSLTANLERLGVLNCAVVHADVRKLADFDLKPDSILLDVPCTGEGVIARDPTRKTSRTMDDIIECSAMQKELLDAALEVLKPGGRLVYSTCSFAPEENETVIDHALTRHPFKLGEIKWGEPGLTSFAGHEFDKQLRRARRFYPHVNGSQGFFVALLEKGCS